jgi:hypothetical protein
MPLQITITMQKSIVVKIFSVFSVGFFGVLLSADCILFSDVSLGISIPFLAVSSLAVAIALQSLANNLNKLK